jgi:hypothetical protein
MTCPWAAVRLISPLCHRSNGILRGKFIFPRLSQQESLKVVASELSGNPALGAMTKVIHRDDWARAAALRR